MFFLLEGFKEALVSLGVVVHVALARTMLRQKVHDLEYNLGYIVKVCLKQTNT